MAADAESERRREEVMVARSGWGEARLGMNLIAYLSYSIPKLSEPGPGPLLLFTLSLSFPFDRLCPVSSY